MQSKIVFIFILQFVFLFPAQAQETSLKWLLPMDAEGMPVGVPGKNAFHFVKYGKLYRATDKGEIREIPYDSITYQGGKYWMIRKGNLNGVWHDSLGEIIPPVYEKVEIAAAESDDCWAFQVSKYGMAAVANEKNKLILPWATSGYTNLRIINDTILEYKKAYKTEYLSKKGNSLKESAVKWMKAPEFKRLSADKFIYTYTRSGKILVDTFSGAEPFSNGLAAVAIKNQWGYILENGSWHIRPQFQAAGPFNKLGFAVVKSNDNYGLVRRSGQPAFAPKFVFLKPFAGGLFEFKEGDRIGLCDTTGKVVLPAGPFTALTPAGNGAFSAQYINKKVELYTNGGERIALDSLVECKGEQDGSVFIVTQQLDAQTKVCGLFNPVGEWVVPPVFTGWIQPYPHYFIANGKVTNPEALPGLSAENFQYAQRFVFNRAGKPVLNFSVNHFVTAKDGPVAIFELNKMYGLVTPDGMLLEAAYNSIQSMGNGWFYLKKDGKSGVLRAF